MISCVGSLKESTTEKTPPRSAILKAGDPAPFSGVLVDALHFENLMIAATRKCNE